MKTPSRFKPLLQRWRFLWLAFALRFSAPFTRWCCSGERGIKWRRQRRDGSSASAEQALFSDGKQTNLPTKSPPRAGPTQVPAALAPWNPRKELAGLPLSFSVLHRLLLGLQASSPGATVPPRNPLLTLSTRHRPA